MEKITSLFIVIILGIITFGCGKEETTETLSAGVIKEIEAEEENIEVEEERGNITTVRLCHDTDNGVVRWVNGTVFGFYDNATRFEFNDYCQNFNYLMEFYCEDEEPKQQIFFCRNGCVDNHCQ